MHQIQEIKQKYFADSKKIISDLYHCDNEEDLIDNKILIDKLLENISFLKLIEKNKEIFNKYETAREENQKKEPLNISEKENNFTELNAEIESPQFQIIEENKTTEELSSEILNKPIEKEMAVELSDSVLDEKIQENENILIENNSENLENISEISEAKQKQDKKVKLAHIKGLKIIESLFDDEYFELEKPVKEEKNCSISETHISDEKSHKEFRLDLNDKIAFSKMLFGGSQMEMNDVIYYLNQCQTLDEAKEYLSDLYYAKKWDRVDDYAQRLWTLVENKFI